jgi:uncharacterized protein YjiS (DUF1127 family)
MNKLPLGDQNQTPAGAPAASPTPQNHSLTQRRGWLATVRLWIEQSRQRRALGELALHSDYLLNDLGLTEAQARREASKPFWRR